MSSIVTAYEHITFNEEGMALIDDTRMKVSQLISEVMAYGWSPQELHFQHPHLSMGQIHSALAYYWDHQQEIDRQIEDELANTEKMRATIGELLLVQRLKAKGLKSVSHSILMRTFRGQSRKGFAGGALMY